MTAATPQPPAPPAGGIVPKNADAIAAATGRDIAAWAEVLDAAGARDMPHPDIATLLVTEHGLTGWWAQGVTVAYEQWTGRRIVGQRCDGSFTASVSRTIPGSPEEVLADWEAFIGPRAEELGLENLRSTSTEKWLYWRADGIDGTRVNATLQAKDDTRCVLAIGHEKIETADAKDAWKGRWRDLMKEHLSR
ncbi:MAG: hypothetical protein Q4G40_03005 [Brachybacterium sp.]|nr:hypothetical protein [Brachybacterium sp.]